MARHTQYDLAQMQSLPLESKIIMTEQRIRGWYEHWDGQVYVSVSGGKDSQVLAHIVKNIYPDVPLVFVNTGLEFDSVRLKGIELADEVLRPAMDFVNVIKKYGYPVISKDVSQAVYEIQKSRMQGKQPAKYRLDKMKGTLINPKTGELSAYNKSRYEFLLDAPFMISHKCCDVMKKNPAKLYEKQSDNHPFIGTLAEESYLRTTKWIKFGCNAFEQKRPTSQPLSFWTEQDILHYIKKYKLEIADIYGDVAYQDDDGMFYEEPLFVDAMKLSTSNMKRTGCVFCMFGITGDTDRFVKLRESEPLKYDFIMRGGKFDENGMWIPHNGLGYKFVIEWINEHGNLDIKL